MKAASENPEQRRLIGAAIEATIRIAVIGALAYWCFQIVSPFLLPLVWGVIIAVAVYPAYRKVELAFGGRKGLAATAFTIVLLVLMLLPVVLLVGTLVDSIRDAAEGLEDGTLKIPPPPESVRSWPFVGPRLYSFWSTASTNIEKAAGQLGPYFTDVGKWLLAAAGQMGIAVVVFLVSVIIAGVYLAYSQKGSTGAKKLAVRLAGERGTEYVKAAESTIRSVAIGVLGIGFIQATLSGVGMLVAGIPGAGLWAFVCLILSITQIGGLPVMLPAAIYMFATADTLPAILFAIWAGFVGIIDNLLAPLMLGRGTRSPNLIIVIGAIGGLVAAGVVGLFIGAVVLTLGYKLFLVWLEEKA